MFLTWKVNIPLKVMTFLEKLKYLVFFEFIKEFYSGISSEAACEDLESICEANQGVASRIKRLNDDGFVENAEVMVLIGILLVLAICIIGVCYLAGKYHNKA